MRKNSKEKQLPCREPVILDFEPTIPIETINAAVDKALLEEGKMKKREFAIKVELSDCGYFVASDKIFYDYGTGYSLEECLLDYVQTIKERVEITKPHESEKIDEKLTKLKLLLTRLPEAEDEL